MEYNQLYIEQEKEYNKKEEVLKKIENIKNEIIKNEEIIEEEKKQHLIKKACSFANII